VIAEAFLLVKVTSIPSLGKFLIVTDRFVCFVTAFCFLDLKHSPLLIFFAIERTTRLIDQ
jgi:hypothetical protein